ncbi:hypothetical protein SAMN04487963_3632 [Marinobacter zhejiangensis]|uniref:Uncharacterized protein n=2 Tax=Marinobacter zhejiangensis TaxID=488535 RepID=A0A1I4THH8_9GAMM|nr:hypothetical protein SAMN04487963_3632 [Marinobacter zhejiangensis]
MHGEFFIVSTDVVATWWGETRECGTSGMTDGNVMMRKQLLDKLVTLSEADPEHYPVVSLDDYFSGNDQEESIAPNAWGYGRPALKDLHQHFKQIESRPDVQGVYVGMHDEWREALDDEELWPAAENIHVISSAPQADVERWIDGVAADGIGPGWPYGKHERAPEPADGSVVYTVYWD